MGRWLWQEFDQAYSNGFAHGISGNVGETGVAGVQRQQDLDDTGWLGSKTFNTLRSARVPEGKPHAGEMAMDATAVNLINEAYAKFKGHEPAAPTETLRQAALATAVTQLGVKESPPDSNQVKYCDWYGMTGPWCMMFVTWAYETTGDSPSFVQGSRYSYVPFCVSDARLTYHGLKTVDPDSVIPGDLVCYDWSFDGEYDHVGIFEKWTSSSTWTAIEGNTSTSNDSNGGQVMRRTRTLGSQGTVFVRVAEP